MCCGVWSQDVVGGRSPCTKCRQVANRYFQSDRKSSKGKPNHFPSGCHQDVNACALGLTEDSGYSWDI